MFSKKEVSHLETIQKEAIALVKYLEKYEILKGIVSEALQYALETVYVDQIGELIEHHFDPSLAPIDVEVYKEDGQRLSMKELPARLSAKWEISKLEIEELLDRYRH